MDSSFVNYDGRSVHDLIEALLAMSGDPETIRRLQESINAVDQRAQSSIAVVNDAIAQLDEDKQDVGDYVLNGGATGYTTFKFSKSAHVQNMRRGNNQYSNGLSILGENSEADLDGVLREWFRYERHTGQLQGYIYKEGTSSWEAVHSWQADEDTGWQTLTGTPIKYRKKNGLVSINIGAMSGAYTYNFTKGQWVQLGTMPTGFRPSGGTSNPEIATIWIRRTSDSMFIPMVCQFASDGIIQVMASETLSVSEYNAILGSVSFPV